jgi:hypothetical protein
VGIRLPQQVRIRVHNNMYVTMLIMSRNIVGAQIMPDLLSALLFPIPTALLAA